MFFGANMFHEYAWVFSDAFEKEVEVYSMGTSDMEHVGTSAFHSHFDYSFIVFKYHEKSPGLVCWDIGGNVINVIVLVGFKFSEV